MTTRFESRTRPKVGVDYRSQPRQRTIGFVLASVGLMLTVLTLGANISAANTTDPAGAVQTLAWSFGLTTVGFGTIKLGIAAILVGILVRLSVRVESVRTSLPDLAPDSTGSATIGSLETSYGPAKGTLNTPRPLPIHRMTRRMWAPMVVMGYVAVLTGMVVSFVWSANVGTRTGAGAQAWTQGLQFLGEGLLLAGISFLLGTILASLREGGGRVQESLGITVTTLNMPTTAKVFVALMAAGLMVSIAQFVLYVVLAAGDPTQATFASWLAWLGPLREFGLGLLLAGIVMALVTIGNVLGFQFDRIKNIVLTGN